ncbi:MAG TPA: protease inhibitor I42 family protein [Gammaproteobacteria bacterium]|nr:protease inhibitor I42 family protein [Gammaproteobacteria bacterium]
MKLSQNKLLFCLANLILFLAIISTNAMSQVPVEKNDTKYPLTDFSKPILVHPQTQTITINLPANPSTGYQWYLLQYDDKLFEPMGYQYIPAKVKLAGAPGVSSWQFQLKKAAFLVPRVTHIQFEYRRSWEVSGGNRQTVTIVSNSGESK